MGTEVFSPQGLWQPLVPHPRARPWALSASWLPRWWPSLSPCPLRTLQALHPSQIWPTTPSLLEAGGAGVTQVSAPSGGRRDPQGTPPQAMQQGWPAHLHHQGQQQFYSEDVQATLCLYWSLQLSTRAEMFLRNLSLTFSSVFGHLYGPLLGAVSALGSLSAGLEW